MLAHHRVPLPLVLSRRTMASSPGLVALATVALITVALATHGHLGDAPSSDHPTPLLASPLRSEGFKELGDDLVTCWRCQQLATVERHHPLAVKASMEPEDTPSILRSSGRIDGLQKLGKIDNLFSFQH